MYKHYLRNQMTRLQGEWEYDLEKKNGAEPLMDFKYLIDLDLRISIQNKLFGGSELSQADIAKGNNKFYRWVWNRSLQFCEETGVELDTYRATYISHILSRGATPDMRWDPRNINILCKPAHDRWEGQINRGAMNIYEDNEKIISRLIWEYRKFYVSSDNY
jgi:hypothetical protein